MNTLVHVKVLLLHLYRYDNRDSVNWRAEKYMPASLGLVNFSVVLVDYFITCPMCKSLFRLFN